MEHVKALAAAEAARQDKDAVRAELERKVRPVPTSCRVPRRQSTPTAP